MNLLWFCVVAFSVLHCTAAQLHVPNATLVPHTNHTNTAGQHRNVPAIYQDFVNQTMGRRAEGVCEKEVPTASLAGYNGAAVRGNGSNPTLSRITVCCQGYQRNAHIRRKCEPICAMGCANGVCYAPNNCICYPDHVKNLAGYCVPTCPIGCDNGVCDGATCKCNAGYAYDEKAKVCVAVCYPPCGQGSCVSPNKCSCNAGYEMTADGACTPKCTKGCEFGECVAPEQCSCRPGFVLEDKACMPVCSKGCANGVCVAPERCLCQAGYRINKIGTCDPHCDKACLNGHCMRPNECQCNAGYDIDAYIPFRCNPHCPEPCVNGVCTSPGRCICNFGFVKDRSTKGSQICIPKPI